MIFYKITNIECGIYCKLKAQREKELKAIKENKEFLERNIPYKYKRYCGYTDQGARRIPIAVGFYFLHPEEVDTKVWREDAKRAGLYFPNKRTKAGRDMQAVIDCQRGFSGFKLLDMLGIDYYGEFSCPQMWVEKGVVLIALDDKHQPKDENLIEITRNELESYFNV